MKISNCKSDLIVGVRFLSDIYRAEKGGLMCRGLKTDGAGKACTWLAWEAQQSFDSNPVESVIGNELMDIKELWVKLQICTANKVSYGPTCQNNKHTSCVLRNWRVWVLKSGFLWGVGFFFSLLVDSVWDILLPKHYRDRILTFSSQHQYVFVYVCLKKPESEERI